MRRAAAIFLALCLCLAVWRVPAGAMEGDGTPTSQEPVTSQPEPTPAGEPASPAPTPRREAEFYIDNQNIYEGMEKSYAQGYVPTLENGTAIVVLPLLCEGRLRGNSLRAKLSLGEGGPFVTKNYEKTVELASHKVNGGRALVEGYRVSFPLPLLSGRVNGSYPVTISVTARDETGGEVRGDFTVYVTVADGIDPNATPTPEPVPTPEPLPTPEPAILGPKLMVQSCEVSSLEPDAQPGVVNAGDSLRVRAVLVNTSKTEALQNMTVTAVGPTEGFALTSAGDSLYFDSLDPEGMAEVVCEYTVKPETPAGQYVIALNYDFAYGNGMTAAGTCNVRANISQPLKMEFSLSQMPMEAVLSDTVQVNVQAINLSHAKAYNVRATLEGDGISPGGTAFIGDLDGGNSAEQPLQVTFTGLMNGNSSYGQTTGTITYLYEDEAGGEHTETGSFTVNIKSPFSQGQAAKQQDDPGQWWVIMAALAVVLLGLGGAFAARAIRRRRA